MIFIQKLWLNYITGNGQNIYPIEVQYKKVNLDQIIYDPEKIRNLCKEGCKNFNFAGGCPPYAPLFDEIIGHKKIRSVFLVSATFWPEYKTERVKESSHMYVHFRLQDQILSRMLHNIGLKIRRSHNCIFLASGYCMGCNSRKCNFKVGIKECRNPSKRTFSMESTGINVCETFERNLDISFKWYSENGDLNIPMTKGCAFFFEQDIYEKTFNSILMTSYERIYNS